MKTVLCFGDSNTHGTRAYRFEGDRRRFSKEKRWPHVMAQALGDGVEVIAEGHPGRTAYRDDPDEGAYKNGARALLALLESHRPVDLLVILLGTNDLKARFDVTAAEIAQGIIDLAKIAKGSDSGPDETAPKLLLVAPVPIIETGIFTEMFAGGAIKSHEIADHLEPLARGLGAHFLNLADVAVVDPDDGIHLDAAAQAAIGAAIAQKVREIL